MMIKFKIIFLISFISSLFVLSGCTTSEKTAALVPISGFGGTGYRPSGFGGTGIVGTITEFGSIWVNGVEVDYNENTIVTSALVEKDTLELGKQVVLETLVDLDKVETTKITIYYPVAGEITKITKDQIVLNNEVTVVINKAKIEDRIQIKVGEFVAINGYKISQNTWVATRVSHNIEHKKFYQNIPNLKFSKAVKQVVIESSTSQLKQWKAVSNGTTENISKKLQRVLLMGKVDNGKIIIENFQSYSNETKYRLKNIMLKKQIKSPMKSPKEGMSQSSRGSMSGSSNSHSGGGSGIGSGSQR